MDQRDAPTVTTVDGDLLLTALQFDLLTIVAQSAGRLTSFEERQAALAALCKLAGGRNTPVRNQHAIVDRPILSQ